VLVGNGNRDYLVGADGHDRVDGGPDHDELSANEGDVVAGGEGHDFLEVTLSDDETGFGAGDDRYEGGPGNDMIRSFLGRDRIDGGAGDDRIFLTHYSGDLFPIGAKDDSKRASVDCAQGKDTIEVGRGDTLRRCELLQMHLPCDVCSLRATLVTKVRGRRVTVARENVSHTASRYYDTMALGARVRRALSRQARIRVRFLLGTDVFRTFTLTR
jgi:Ca2+-binding RTX toxin-like protein